MFRVSTLVISVLLVFGLTGGSALASSGSKNINVQYDNIKLQLDGQPAQISSEPFISNGVTYVPLRDIATLTGLKVEWDGTNRIIKLSRPSINTNSSISTYIPTLTGDTEENTRLAALICQKYGKLDTILFEKISLTGNSRNLNVSIQFDLTNNLKDWNALTDRTIEAWLSEIIKEIQKYYSSGTNITGNIIRKSTDSELISFKKDGERTIMVQYFDGSYRKGIPALEDLQLESDYLGTVFFVSNIKFFVTATNYSKNNELLDINFTSSKNGDFLDWKKISNSIIAQDTINNCKDIAQYFKTHESINLNQINIRYYDKSSKYLDSFVYDVVNNKIVYTRQHKGDD